MGVLSHIRILVVASLILSAWNSWAQSTRVRGCVRDATTGAPIPYVSVLFTGTTTGIPTDTEGIYSLETREPVDSVTATLVGYQTQTKAIVRGAYNEINFSLQPISVDVGTVTVTPGENPAHRLLDSIRRYKWRNDPNRLQQYICDTYTKMELSLSGLKPYFKNKRLQRNFGFIFEHMDTSAITGKTYLPAMISETMARKYHRTSPALTREVISASRMSGFSDDQILAQFSGQMMIDANFYDNTIGLFNIRFISPLSESGRLFYRYFLVDSIDIDNRKTYKIRFHPRSLASAVLDGEVNIDSATYALQSAHVRMPKGVNVNWIKHLVLDMENTRINDTLWFRKFDRMTAEFSIALRDSSKLTSFIGQREVSYLNPDFTSEIPSEVSGLKQSVAVEEYDYNQTRWDSLRPYALSDREQAIYSMVDSIQNVPLYRDIYAVIKTIVGGYYETPYIGFGPYYKILSFNDLEGVRFQLGARTTSDFSRTIRLTGHVAYGSDDQRFKGAGTVELAFNRGLTRKLTLEYKHDAVQLGAGSNALTESNILSSVFSRGDERLSMVDHARVNYDHEWFHGFFTSIEANARHICGNRFVPMLAPDGTLIRAINSFTLGAGIRFSWDEKIVRRPFDNYFLGSKYPILALRFTAGIPGVMHNDYEYYRIEGGLQYRLNIPPLGFSRLRVEGGRLFGRVPYPLLKLHEGNGTYFYDPYAFSCMNFYEFASDKWVSFFYEHHFNGLLFGRLPLLKKLHWREILICKGTWGNLSAGHHGFTSDSQSLMRFPEGMSSVDKPYVEIGAGVENIFRVVRLDFIWRLTHRQPVEGQKIQKFAVNVSFALSF